MSAGSDAGREAAVDARELSTSGSNVSRGRLLSGQLHRPGIDFADIAVVVGKNPRAARAITSRGRRFATLVAPGTRMIDPSASLGTRAPVHPLPLLLRWIRPEREVETPAPFPAQAFEFIQSRAADTGDFVLLALVAKIIGVAAGKENPGRGKLARDHPRKIGPESREKTRLHGSTL